MGMANRGQRKMSDRESFSPLAPSHKNDRQRNYVACLSIRINFQVVLLSSFSGCHCPESLPSPT